MTIAPLIICGLLAAGIGLLPPPADAAGPQPTQPWTQAPPAAGSSIASTCAVHGYTCPQAASCQFKAAPPPGAGAAATYVAFACRYPQQQSGVSATSCPSGLMLQQVSGPSMPGTVTVATWRCVPSPRACPGFDPAWVRHQVRPFTPPALGYECAYRRVAG